MTPSAGGRQHWQPGDPLSEDDRALLAPLLGKARELGRTPVRREVASADAIKRRFRTWGNAVRAAGLPWVNYPEQRRLAGEARRLSRAAPDHPHQPHQPHDNPDPDGSPAAGQVSRSVRGATSDGGHAGHESPEQ